MQRYDLTGEYELSMQPNSEGEWVKWEDHQSRVAELEAALGAALDPLDLYHAYGWQDRNGVRASLRRLLNH